MLGVFIALLILVIALMFCYALVSYSEKEKVRQIRERSDKNMVGIIFSDGGKKYIVTKVDRSYCGGYCTETIYVEEYKKERRVRRWKYGRKSRICK